MAIKDLEVQMCTGCGWLSSKPIGDTFVACCPDNRYRDIPPFTWFKDGNFWRKAGEPWEKTLRGIYTHGLGDLIYNTLSKIVDDNDTSDWAYDALDACYNLLLCGQRWPDRLNGIESKNYLHWRWSRVVYKVAHQRGNKWSYLNGFGKIVVKLGYKNVQKYRPQGNMTRDPFAAFDAACLHLGMSQLIEFVPIPLHLYTPQVWKNRNRLINDDRPQWIQRLGYYRAIAAKLEYERKFKKP